MMTGWELRGLRLVDSGLAWRVNRKVRMKALSLNQIEEDILVQVLKQCVAGLIHEIDHTHHGEFRQMLRERRNVLEGILGKLPARVVQPA